MDRAVIIGVYDFIGFQLCCSLLEKGFEVVGVYTDSESEDAYLSEKRLEIGRNANFYEKTPEEWLDEEKICSQTLVLIDCYDFDIHTRKRSVIENYFLKEFFAKNSDNIEKSNSKIVSIFPVRLHVEPNETLEMMSNMFRAHHIFLPTIYGPWQPSSYLFQQYLLKAVNPNQHIKPNENEWVHDSLYIEDIVDPILQIAQERLADSWLLESDTPHHWKKCAQYISIPEQVINDLQNPLPSNEEKIKRTIVKSLTPFQEGLERQKRHLRLFHQGSI